MKSLRLTIRLKIILFFITLLLFGCSFHYDQGLKLEKEKRWAEAAIEYRIAAIEDPENEVIREALKRMNLKVAAENFEIYKGYLKEKEFHKAFRRLESALSLNPDHSDARSEMNKWWHLLITGKVELEFSRFSSNLRLAEEMEMQVLINSPKGKLLTGKISSESRIFFIEDVVYKPLPQQLAEYSINSIGLKIKRKSSEGFLRTEFKKFVNFRELSPLNVSGWNNNAGYEEPKDTLDHRPTLITDEKQLSPWSPPRLLTYELKFTDNIIKVLSETNRAEFAPEVLYINEADRRANIDFGVSLLEMNSTLRKWSIRRKKFNSPGDDYFYGLSRNLPLNRYFYYDRVFRFIP